ncbi:MAG: ABC transporter substrate-binding protein [Anaerolineaceae bacterium]|nr:ABC transporter substrate-binding protein [Anaerolineaceae bacterium]
MLLSVLIPMLAACQSTPVSVSPTQELATPVPPLPTPTATPEPRTLVVCVGQEPETLYPYGGISDSTWSILEAVYDGPFDTRQFSTQPVILSKMPNLSDGDAAIQAVDVAAGDEIVNYDGDLVSLTAGTRLLPSGCSGQDCAITWDGTSPLQMDQLSVAFRLLPGLTWSDGTPLQASDSVYSFQLASANATPVSKQVVYRTASYAATDDLTVKWVGLPGYLPQQYSTLFWMPLPEHVWGAFSPEALLTSEVATRAPLGWGPYVIDEWVPGDHIQLSKNPAYFRASEGLPAFDYLVYRFMGEASDNNLAALEVGECDIIDAPTLLEDQLEPILEMQQANKLKAYIGQGPEWEHLDFGIRPSSYDDGYYPYSGERPDYFSDIRMRQALTYCMNRSGIVHKPLMDQSSVPATFLAPSSPLYMPELSPLSYDVEAGKALLDQIGWVDDDGDPATPRTSLGVANVLDGASLVLNYATTEAALRVEVARQLSESLAQCGVQVNVQYYTPGELYAPGPDGILFGRKFDLAQFAWESGTTPACWLYETSQIPTAENKWLGVNVTGYSSPEYDVACASAMDTHPDQADLLQQRQQEVARLFAQDLPVVPLFYRLKMAVSRPDLCGFDMDVTARSVLWNLESLDYGSGCQ